MGAWRGRLVATRRSFQRSSWEVSVGLLVAVKGRGSQDQRTGSDLYSRTDWCPYRKVSERLDRGIRFRRQGSYKVMLRV